MFECFILFKNQLFNISFHYPVMCSLLLFVTLFILICLSKCIMSICLFFSVSDVYYVICLFVFLCLSSICSSRLYLARFDILKGESY